MRRCVVSSPAAKADDLYDFVVRCRAEPVAVCFRRISATLEQVRREDQGRALRRPKIWHPAPTSSQTYPVSFVDYLMPPLSAARVTRPGDPHSVVLRDALADIHQCREATH